MRRSTIMQRLALLAAVPLIALTLSAVFLVWQAVTTLRDASHTQYLMDLSIRIGNLVHTLQIERGATAGFVQSRGQRLAEVVPGARSRTNENLESYRKEALKLDADTFPSLGHAISAANSKLEALDDLRRRADQFSVPAAETTAYYTSAIAQLVSAIGTGGGGEKTGGGGSNKVGGGGGGGVGGGGGGGGARLVPLGRQPACARRRTPGE